MPTRLRLTSLPATLLPAMHVLLIVVVVALAIWATDLWLRRGARAAAVRRGCPDWVAGARPMRGVDVQPDGASLPETTPLAKHGVDVVQSAEHVWWVRYALDDSHVVGRHIRLANDAVESEYFLPDRRGKYDGLLVAIGGGVAAALALAMGWSAARGLEDWEGLVPLGAAVCGEALVIVGLHVRRGAPPGIEEVRGRLREVHATWRART
jgi:hypothetical protein